MRVAESLLQKIVRRLLEVSQPDRIILFGSAAKGQMTRDSDIDLLVLEASPQEPRRHSVRLRNALRAGLPLRRDRDGHGAVRGNQRDHRRPSLPGEQVWAGDL